MAEDVPDSAAVQLDGLAAALARRLGAYARQLADQPLETEPAKIEREVRFVGSLARVGKSILLLGELERKLARKAADQAADPADDDLEPSPVTEKKTQPHEDPERAARLYARLDARLDELAGFFESKGVARGPVPGRLGSEAERVGWREPAQQPDLAA